MLVNLDISEHMLITRYSQIWKIEMLAKDIDNYYAIPFDCTSISIWIPNKYFIVAYLITKKL